MADGDYLRLTSACACVALLAKVPSGRGGKRAGAGRNKGAQKKERPPATHAKCPCCGALFERKRHGRMVARCDSCREKPQRPRKAYEKRPTGSASCALESCSNTFIRYLPHERYCSKSCYLGANAERLRNRQDAARDRSARKCKMCGESFAPSYGDKRSVFCSRECKVRRGYQNSAGSTHRRRAKKFGVDYEPIKKWDVFARDDWTCQLCGVKTPRKFSGTQRDDAPELDHILPLAAGGAHILSNVQCACRKCNLHKSDRPLGQMLLF